MDIRTGKEIADHTDTLGEVRWVRADEVLKELEELPCTDEESFDMMMLKKRLRGEEPQEGEMSTKEMLIGGLEIMRERCREKRDEVKNVDTHRAADKEGHRE